MHGDKHGGFREHAELGAAVTLHQVPVIALLHAIDGAVAAPRQGAIDAAGSVGKRGITFAAIALFAQFCSTVAAGRKGEAAIVAAAVGQGRIVEERFALFSQCALKDAVAAGSPLQRATRGASVSIQQIGIVAFLKQILLPIAARLQSAQNVKVRTAPAITPVAIRQIAVIALFARFGDAVAADGFAADHGRPLPTAECGASVSVFQISVVTELPGPG